jgi:NAD(P)-dependent dehydrogenase (short-subunit alcohol dehydrogenase family)
MNLEISGKVVIVTGGSSGIGLESARKFAEEGCNVVICSRSVEKLEAAVEEIQKSTGVRITAIQVDVTKKQDLDNLVNTVKARFGSVDILINNAGTGTYKPFLEVSDEELKYGMDINFFAQFRLCQRVIPIMIQQGKGSIINVSGETGINILGEPFLATCTGPAKSAEIRFTKNLAHEFGRQNIRVNCVVPGLVHTSERFEKWEREMVKKQNLTEEEAENVRKAWARSNPIPDGRWGTPEELADLIVFAASERASYINGAVLIVDGGQDKS